MNPWDIASWAGAIVVTLVCVFIGTSLVLSLVKKFRDTK